MIAGVQCTGICPRNFIPIVFPNVRTPVSRPGYALRLIILFVRRMVRFLRFDLLYLSSAQTGKD
jgi:hypothetical protein